MSRTLSVIVVVSVTAVILADGSVVSAAGCSSARSVVSSPSPSQYNWLEAVAAVSSDDVWAVGGDSTDQNSGKTLIEHWNGSAWSVVPRVSPSIDDDFLFGVDAIPAGAWAVGSDQANTMVQWRCPG
jgi:hypothetical protein